MTITESRHARPSPQPRLPTTLRLIARRVHFLAGVVVAPFLAVLCLTGLAYVFSPQIHESLYHSDLFVAHASGVERPVSDQISAALTAHPELRLKAVITSPDPGRTTRVVLSAPGSAGAPDRTVFVDPYTGYLNGELTTVEDRLPANTWLRQLHSNLQLGNPGRVYAELAASWLPVIVLGGLVLLAGGIRRKRDQLPAAQGKPSWQRLRGRHATLGIWLTAGLLIASVTGLAMSQFAGGRASSVTDPLHLRAPVLAAAPVAVPADGRVVDVDKVLTVARSAGLVGELRVVTPRTAGMPYTVTEITEGLPMHRGAVAIDPYTAKVTEHLGWADYSLPAKLSTLGTEFHTGSLFGLANQILLALVALATLVLIGLGYRMWWARNPYRGRLTALPRPVWRQVSPAVLIVALLGVAALAWLLPVFGASLLLFVAVDAGINRYKGSRSRPAEPPPSIPRSRPRPRQPGR